MKPRKPQPEPVQRWWIDAAGFQIGEFRANTRSEARALAKQEWGLERLPEGTKIEKIAA